MFPSRIEIIGISQDLTSKILVVVIFRFYDGKKRAWEISAERFQSSIDEHTRRQSMGSRAQGDRNSKRHVGSLSLFVGRRITDKYNGPGRCVETTRDHEAVSMLRDSLIFHICNGATSGTSNDSAREFHASRAFIRYSDDFELWANRNLQWESWN
jgi:hypothetical protein